MISFTLTTEQFKGDGDKLEEEPARVLHRNIVHPLLFKRVYAECRLLFQLIKLINILKVGPNDQIQKGELIGFGFKVTQIFLIKSVQLHCYSCGRL